MPRPSRNHDTYSHEWPRHRVDVLQSRGILLVEDGNHGEYRPLPHEFTPTGTAFIRAADMDNHGVLFDSAQRINEIALARIRKGIGRGGDILFSHKGTVGKLAIVPLDAPPFVCSPQTTFWRVLDSKRLDRDFLYYFMQSKGFASQWEARKGETDMADYVSLTSQRELQIAIPDIDIQKAIGSTLRSIDDKVQTIRRTNQTIERVVSGLFRSWFVDFDPVVAKAAGRTPFGLDVETAKRFPSAFADSNVGPIPKSWRIGTLGEVALNVRIIVNPRDLDESTPYIALDHMPRRSIALHTWTEAKRLLSGKFCFSAGDILFGKLRPYFHKVGVAPVDGVCSTDILVIKPAEYDWLGFVLGHISSDDMIEHADNASTGTKMPRVNWLDLAAYKVVQPPPPLAAAFTAVVSPMISKLSENVREMRALEALRNSLLPKLFAGELPLAMT